MATTIFTKSYQIAPISPQWTNDTSVNSEMSVNSETSLNYEFRRTWYAHAKGLCVHQNIIGNIAFYAGSECHIFKSIFPFYMLLIFLKISMTSLGLGNPSFKFHDFSTFSMPAWILISVLYKLFLRVKWNIQVELWSEMKSRALLRHTFLPAACFCGLQWQGNSVLPVACRVPYTSVLSSQRSPPTKEKNIS